MTSPFAKVKVPRDGSVASYTSTITRSDYSGLTTGRLHVTHPFHTISWSNLSEFLIVAQNSYVWLVGELWVICGRPKVDFALGFSNRMKTSSRG